MMSVMSTDDDTTVKSPGKFKSETKWKTFKEGMISYLNALNKIFLWHMSFMKKRRPKPAKHSNLNIMDEGLK
jgi:hypothetical protein